MFSRDIVTFEYFKNCFIVHRRLRFLNILHLRFVERDHRISCGNPITLNLKQKKNENLKNQFSSKLNEK